MILGRREGVLPPENAYIMRFMVANSLGAALLAMLAFVLHRLHVPEPLLWRVCSGIYLVFAAGFIVLSVVQERSLRKTEGMKLPTPIFWLAANLSHAVQLSNCVGFPWAPSEGMFLLGLYLLLALSAAQFVSLLFIASE